MPEISAAASFRSGAVNFNSWILFFQYSCCLGVELTMYNAAALYFADQFGQSTEHAAAIASTFGWLNLFARGAGGFIGDTANAKMGMRGRLFVQATFLLIEGAIVLVFANAKSLAGSIVAMTAFCLFSQAASGSTFGIVPYVNPAQTGSIAGIVGAGGNVGAVLFGLGFRQLSYKQAFTLMGSVILVSSLLTMFVTIKGHRGILFGKDDDEPTAKSNRTLTVPDKDPEKANQVVADEAKA
jgi:NNP family nitrate/nitrite transporter-like MFS transporter